MLQAIVIGNLGADAEKKNLNGNDYISFRVAHTERYGERERTQWVSVLMSGSRTKLLDYLTKGSRVCVVGRMSVRAFSSPATKQWEAGVDVFADVVELVGMRQQITPENISKALSDGVISLADVSKIVAEHQSDEPF